jgi:PAT family beta-lactamase induction signal transducer AmpG
MKFPNLLATRNGRLSAFFLMYITEGIPLGFAATAIATQMRRQGVSATVSGLRTLPMVLGLIVASVAAGNVVSSDNFGRRRAWIIAMQLAMVASLFLLRWSDGRRYQVTDHADHRAQHSLPQDVAIDALAYWAR